MSINKFQPHLLVLPEDSANEQIAIGFRLKSENYRDMRILHPAGGWSKVLATFQRDYVSRLRECPDCNIVLLIDFDGHPERLDKIKDHIPPELTGRVFVLGVSSEPEDLKRDIKKSFQDIGKALAQDCSDETNILWSHNLLQQNESELNRMDDVRRILFSPRL